MRRFKDTTAQEYDCSRIRRFKGTTVQGYDGSRTHHDPHVDPRVISPSAATCGEARGHGDFRTRGGLQRHKW
jgi:hypothetical protein